MFYFICIQETLLNMILKYLWFAGKIIFTLFMLEGMQTLTQILVWSRSGICYRTDT